MVMRECQVLGSRGGYTRATLDATHPLLGRLLNGHASNGLHILIIKLAGVFAPCASNGR